MATNSIQKGDQYAIPFELTFDGELVIPADVDDVRIQIGSLLKSYADGELTFDSENTLWEFPLTESETRKLDNQSNWQFAVKINDEYYYSSVHSLLVKNSIILKKWDDD